ncbi:hypothetical protein KFL_000270010 [Klebsormidium nitens]|uniref:Uncharacterized protein n=1 Tax=Klebsormidium nitens TaxID=105231 RepID=A0A1Y1HND6_KLENI|nr:hypothetical protein KFL_000270010 [Klebsormidium nitens]|eukprot:GAQ79242.1 hypothetical protein KFL_000270010 [Klebsormidium nitens]
MQVPSWKTLRALWTAALQLRSGGTAASGGRANFRICDRAGAATSRGIRMGRHRRPAQAPRQRDVIRAGNISAPLPLLLALDARLGGKFRAPSAAFDADAAARSEVTKDNPTGGRAGLTQEKNGSFSKKRKGNEKSGSGPSAPAKRELQNKKKKLIEGPSGRALTREQIFELKKAGKCFNTRTVKCSLSGTLFPFGNT